MTMNDSAAPSAWLAHYLRHRRAYEIGAWVALTCGTIVANSLVATMDLERGHRSFDWYEPYIWEFSSNLMLLVLLPALLWAERRFPIRVDAWRRAVSVHLLVTIPYSLVHVIGMVWIRQLLYRWGGDDYDFGNWSRELWYEYLKDARTYGFFLVIVYLYRLVLIRLQGEARLLTAPDSGPPLEAVDRPERFLVRKFGAEFLVAARDIEWLEASENYVNLHVRGRAYPLRSTMNAIQDRLDPVRFVRVHRSFIINLDYLAQIEPLESGDARLLMQDGTRVSCSRRYRPALKGEGSSSATM